MYICILQPYEPKMKKTDVAPDDGMTPGDRLRLTVGCSVGLGQCLAVLPGRLALPLPGPATAEGADSALLWRLCLSTSGDPLRAAHGVVEEQHVTN